LTVPATTAATTPKPKVRAMQYERRGSVLAIAPKAFFETFFMFEEPERENTEAGGACIVDIREPLEQYEHPYYDSFADILRRVDAACESPATAVILRFDSPGGEAAGCFEAAREVRAKCDAAGKELHAFIDGDCCSAAYAFASVCQSITVGETSLTGSIGVIIARDDYSAANVARGHRVAFIASGARKADGHPDNPITDAELASMQVIVDEMAGCFFEHVRQTRGLATQTIAQLEAKILPGNAAVAAGLADEVGSLSTVLAKVASGTKGQPMANAYEKAITALQEAAKGEDANAAAAKRMLAASESGGGNDENTPPPDPEEKPAKKDGDDDGPGAAGDPPSTDDDKKKDSPAAVAAMRAALAAQRDATAARMELKAMREDAERATLIASRPGMAPEMVALLKEAPIALVREHIGKMPEQPINPTLAEKPRQGATAGAHGLGLPPDEKRKLDIKMGLVPRTPGDESTETKLVLGGRSARLQAAADAAPAKTN
jgi:ClpP class serine protease